MSSIHSLTGRLITATVLALGAAAAQAGVVLDWSPQATGGTVTNDYWTNMSPGQHFAEHVKFNASTAINGIDIFDGKNLGNVGSGAKVTIWSNAGAQPGGVLASYTTTISIADTSGTVNQNEQRLHADFSDFVMLAGVDYWIGMSGFGTVFTQTGLNGVAGGDGRMAQFNSNDSFSYFATIGDMAFRLYGQSANIPEPATLALTGLALLGVAGVRRQRKAN
jgi:hypothetical protein